jgi:cobalt-zinc-cadmium efflux system outer membrane protein
MEKGKRMSSRKITGSLLAFLILSSGCASVELDAGFSDVRTAIAERNSNKIFWNSGTELDKEAADSVRSLLKQRLTMNGAVQVALLSNRDLQAMYSELGVAQADLVQAGLLKNPIFDAIVKFPVSGGRPDLELTAVMNFLDVFYMPLRKRVAAARFEETKLRVTGSVLDFAGQVRKAFYLHQANAQMLELRQTIVQALGASLEVARRLYDAGNITDLNLARERALAEAAKLQLRSTEMTLSQSREQLNILMGLWGRETEWHADERLPEIPTQPALIDDIESVALSRSVDLSNARQRIVVAGEQLGFSKATALIPNLDIGARGERNDGAWEAGPVFEFPIPLFDQGQGQTGRAAAELRRAQQEYYALGVRVRSTARAVRDRMQGSQDRALYYRDILLPLHERIVNESQLHYNAMQLGVFELIRAREQQIETAAAYIEALRDYWLARADLEQILSGRLPSSTGFQLSPTAGQILTNATEGH